MKIPYHVIGDATIAVIVIVALFVFAKGAANRLRRAKHKRFIVGAVGLGVMLALNLYPELGPFRQQLTALSVGAAALLIGGLSYAEARDSIYVARAVEPLDETQGEKPKRGEKPKNKPKRGIHEDGTPFVFVDEDTADDSEPFESAGSMVYQKYDVQPPPPGEPGYLRLVKFDIEAAIEAAQNQPGPGQYFPYRDAGFREGEK